MTPILFIVAASAGALIRHLLGQVSAGWLSLIIANVAGSVILGYVVESDWSTPAKTVIGVAFCGSLTTFSSATLQTHDLGWRRGALYAVGMLVLCLAGVAVGNALA